jgi:Flp pilus assembly protein protease CpaA
MNLGFLFWLFFVGIVIATLQDLKRREVDDWLNLFLLISSFSFIFYSALFLKDISIIFRAGFALVILFGVMNIFYHGRVFAGGDAKLLFAMTVLFVGANFFTTLANIGIFLLFLMFSGAIYGLTYSLILYGKNFKKVNSKIKKEFGNTWLRYAFLLGILFFVLSYLNLLFLVFAIVAFIFPLLYAFSKGLESVVMIRTIDGGSLREGDWLEKDVKIGNKLIRAEWGGLSLKDIKLLSKIKKVKIKEGIPFVPAFLIAFLAYVFLKDWFVGTLLGIV